MHQVEMFVGVFVGAVTFTGSVVAFGKLQGVIRSKPLLLPGRHLLNLAAVVACVVLGVLFVAADGRRAACGRSSIKTVLACAPRHPPRDGDRRRRHAGRRLDAQQLFGMGGGGGRASCCRTTC